MCFYPFSNWPSLLCFKRFLCFSRMERSFPQEKARPPNLDDGSSLYLASSEPQQLEPLSQDTPEGLVVRRPSFFNPLLFLPSCRRGEFPFLEDSKTSESLLRKDAASSIPLENCILFVNFTPQVPDQIPFLSPPSPTPSSVFA